MDWRTAFQTDSRADVEAYCASRGMRWSWTDDDGLRTERTAPAVRRHPRTGVAAWFNHLVLFHESALRPELRESLIEVLGPDNLPNNVHYADGAPIPDTAVDAVRAAFAHHTIRWNWAAGDLLVVDNMRWSHGREAFDGERRLLVSMSDPVDASA